MGVCGSKSVAVGNEQHDTADSAASLTGASQSTTNSVYPNTSSQLRAAAKTAWQTSARNLRTSLNRSRRRQDSYHTRSKQTGTTSDLEEEELDSAGRSGRPGAQRRRRPTPPSSSPAAAGSSVAWQSSSCKLKQQSGQKLRCVIDSAKVGETSGTDEACEQDADKGESCVRSFHVRNNQTDSMNGAEEEECEAPSRLERRQPSDDGSQRRRRPAVSSATESGINASFPDTSPMSDAREAGGWTVEVPARAHRNGSPAESGGAVAETSPPTTGGAGRRPQGDGGWTAPPPAATEAAVAAQAATAVPPPSPTPVAISPAADASTAPAAEAAGPTTDGGGVAAAAATTARAAAVAPVAAASADVVQWVIRPSPPVESTYALGEVLGKGSFGVVRAATHLSSGCKVAVKTIRKSLLAAADVSALRREVEILHHLSGHPAISQLLGVYEEPSQLHLVLELYQGGDLFDAIIAMGRHSERAAANVMRTVLTAISYCHAMGVAHRDIKPENFMLTVPLNPPAGPGAAAAAAAAAGHPQQQQPAASADAAAGGGGSAGAMLGAKLKLIDFGLSVFCSDSQPLTDTVGTSYYVAPEVLTRCYKRSADVWSAGVILHILLTGYAPFDGRNDQEILRAVQAGKLDLTSDPIWTSISRDATAVLTAMLHRDPDKRATADQLLAMPWLGRTASDCTASPAPLPGVVSDRMRRFARMHSFKKEARRVLAAMMRPEEVAGLVAQFRALDADGDGKLNVQELREGLARQELQSKGAAAVAAVGAADAVGPPRMDDLQELVDRSDLNGDGLLDQSEFLGAALPTAVIARQAQRALSAATAAATTLGRPGSRTTALAAAAAANPLAAAFAHFDADGSGFITPDELRSALACHHPESQGPDVRALLSRVDRDADGRISYPEFVEMLVQEVDDEGEVDGGARPGVDRGVDAKVRGAAGGVAKGRGDSVAAARTGGKTPQVLGLRQAQAQGQRGPNAIGAYVSDPASVAARHDGGRSCRGGGVAAAAAAAAAAAKRRLKVPAAWGIGVPAPGPPTAVAAAAAAARARNAQGLGASFLSMAAVQSGSGRLSSIDWFDECSSRGGVETSGDGDDGAWGRGDARDGSGYGMGYCQAPVAPGAGHAGLYLAAEAAALTLMGGCGEADGEGSLLQQMSVESSTIAATAQGTAPSAAGPAYLASRPPAIVIPQPQPQPAAARRTRRYSAAETLDEAYGKGFGGGGATAFGVNGGGGGVVTERVVRVPRMSEGQGCNHSYTYPNRHAVPTNGPRQHAALHPGVVHARGGIGIGPSPLGGHRGRHRQISYSMEDQAASAGGVSISNLRIGVANGRGRYSSVNGGGVSAPVEQLVSPFSDGCGGGFRQRGAVLQPQPPRAQGLTTAAGSPGGGGGGQHGHHQRRAADSGRSDDDLLAALSYSCGGGGGGRARLDPTAVLPPGACGEEGFPNAPTTLQYGAAGRHRRSVGAGQVAELQQQQQQRPLPPQEASLGAVGLTTTTGRCSQYGSGGAGGVLSEPLPCIGFPLAGGGGGGGGLKGSGGGGGAGVEEGVVLRQNMPS